MRVLRDRRGHIKGRCSVCPYFEICNGNLRARAESYYGDPWAEDPSCYLSDESLGIIEPYERLEPQPSRPPAAVAGAGDHDRPSSEAEAADVALPPAD